MTKSARERNNVFGFLGIVVLSTVSMVWLFWHHPVSTGIVTLVVLAGFGVSARLARLMDTDGRLDLGSGREQSF